MIKIVVFDSGYGGELLADRLEEEFPAYKILRVIDWRHSAQILKNPKEARRAAAAALRPYLNKVDLIVFANFLLSSTSLKYFRKKFPQQKFIGFSLPKPRLFKSKRERRILILSTKALAKTLKFKLYLFNLRRFGKVKIAHLDHWVEAIDDGELTDSQIRRGLLKYQDFRPNAIILTCSQFIEIESKLKSVFAKRFKTFHYYDGILKNVRTTLKIFDYQSKTSGFRSRQNLKD